MHLFLEERQIYGMYGLKIIFSVLILRSVNAVHKVIVHRQHFRLDSIYHQLNLQTLGERRLSGRRRTADKHNLRALFRDSISRLSYLLLVQRLG